MAMESATAQPTRGMSGRHLPSLDGVRGIAIILVLLWHAWPTPWTVYGAVGVDLFFVLSGFLITGILADARDSTHRARTFYVRRALRIMPLYYGVLFLVFVVVRVVYRPHNLVYLQLLRDQVWYWTYTTNWLIAFSHSHIDYLGHFWSLAVEEQFYLLWPVIVWNTSRKTACRIACGAIVGALLCRLTLAALGVWWYPMYGLTPCRLDSLGVGAAIALALRGPGDIRTATRQIMRRLLYATVVAIALLLVLTIADQYGGMPSLWLPHSVDLTVVALVSGLLVTVAAMREPRILQGRVLRTMGLYSYGLYVIHPLVLAWLRSIAQLERLPFVCGVVGVVISYLLAWLSYHGFEKHFLRLKSRLAPTRDNPVGQDTCHMLVTLA